MRPAGFYSLEILSSEKPHLFSKNVRFTGWPYFDVDFDCTFARQFQKLLSFGRDPAKIEHFGNRKNFGDLALRDRVRISRSYALFIVR